MYLKRQKFSKLVTMLSIFALVVNTFLTGIAFAPAAQAVQPAEDLCEVPVDAVLVMDRSGSMADGGAPSQCDWWDLELVGLSYQWVKHTDYDVDQAWCDAKDKPDPHGSAFSAATQSKIDKAKDAGKSFVDNMGASDQSALVSFSDLATLDKVLSSSHSATKSAIDALVPDGSTNIGDAIGAGIAELGSARANPQATKVMVLLTDGKANKPNGNGSGEDPQDVAYAESKASEAAGFGYKIFTIGLGSNGDVNEGMLQNIANTTGATYHNAPSGDDLAQIYDDIAWEICQYGSISGCKYNDLDNSGTIDQGEPTIESWEINLVNGESTSTQTTVDGCYSFSGLVDGEYAVTETQQDGWVQTYPESGSYTVTIAGHNDVVDQDFANYYPECGNTIQDDGEECDDGNLEDGDGCSAQCTIEVADPVCGNGVQETGESCDDGNTDDGDGCSATCTIEVPAAGDVVINEVMQNPSGSDTYKEWFELYNTSGQSWDLQNCVISDNNGDSHTISSSLVIAAGGYLTLVRGSLNPLLNGGIINPDYVYSSFILGNGIDEVVLTCNQTEVDRVEYDDGVTFPDPNGKSMILANPNLDNNVGANWCESVSMFGAGDLGTPGSANDPCTECGDPIEDSRECSSDGYATVYYSYADPTCGGAWSQQEADPDCACDYSPWVDGECVSLSERQQTRENLTQHEYCTDTSQAVPDTSCGGPPTLPGYLKIWKYEDMDGDLNTTDDRFPVSDWSFTVDSGTTSSTATTTVNGYALFEVVPGDHAVTEEIKDNWYLLDESIQGHSFSVTADQTTEVKYYNTEYSTISGHKYEDIDGDSGTSGDRVFKSDWLINLFSSNSTSTDPVATTTTDVDGYFEFAGLVPGDYTVVEDEPEYWVPLTATSTEFTLESGTATSTSFVNWYDGPDGYIFGCKWEDTNNNGILDDGEEKKGGFEIILERYEGDEWAEVDRQVTESDTQSQDFGCYRFNYLISGNYRVSEASQEGWQQTYPHDPDYYVFDLVEETPTTTIDFYNYYFGYCGDNIVNGTEECDGSAPGGYTCNSSCVLEGSGGGGGGGGFISRPDVELDLTYELSKNVGEAYVETIVVSNTGNIILSNGVLSIDLPEDKLSFVSAYPEWDTYTTSTQSASWNIGALNVSEDLTYTIEVSAESEGEAITSVEVVFDQADDSDSMVEDIFFTGVGGGPEEEEETGGGEGEGEEGEATGGAGLIGEGGGEGEEDVETSSAATTSDTEEEEGEVAGEEDENGEVLGVSKCNDGALWWMWILVALVHIIVLAIYYYFLLSPDDNKEGGIFDPGEEGDSKFDQPKDKEDSGKFEFKGSWIWWWPGILGTIVIFLILSLIGGLSVLPLILVLLAYFGALLAMHWLLLDSSDITRIVSLAVLATLAPVITLIFCQGFSPMGWVGVIVVYVLGAIAFAFGLMKKEKTAFNLMMLAIVAISILVFILEYLIYWCACF